MFQTLARHYRRWILRRIAIRELRWMDDRLLRDIGAKRSAIPGFVDSKSLD